MFNAIKCCKSSRLTGKTPELCRALGSVCRLRVTATGTPVLTSTLDNLVYQPVCSQGSGTSASVSPMMQSQSLRWYMRKKTIKIPPTKPLTFDYSGDLEKTLPPIDTTQPKLGFEDIPELQSADDRVKKLFSLEFADGKAILDKRLEEIKRKVREHPADIRSLEVKVAILTILIRNQMRHVLDFRKDKVAKSRLVERIQSREKTLIALRQMDTEKFEWLQRELKIRFVPRGPNAHIKISKRGMRQKVASDRLIHTKWKKMDDFRDQLERDKAAFFAHKEKELARIAEEVKDLGAAPEATLVESLEELGLLPEKPEPAPRIKHSRLVLLHKFAQWEKLKKEQAAQTPT